VIAAPGLADRNIRRSEHQGGDGRVRILCVDQVLTQRGNAEGTQDIIPDAEEELVSDVGEPVDRRCGGEEQYPVADQGGGEVSITERPGVPEMMAFINDDQGSILRLFEQQLRQPPAAHPFVRPDSNLDAQPRRGASPLGNQYSRHQGNRGRAGPERGGRQGQVGLSAACRRGQQRGAVPSEHGKQAAHQWSLMFEQPAGKRPRDLGTRQCAGHGRNHGGNRRPPLGPEHRAQRIGQRFERFSYDDWNRLHPLGRESSSLPERAGDALRQAHRSDPDPGAVRRP
jgi:hypothetical protein